jgi:hypothetical protein
MEVGRQVDHPLRPWRLRRRLVVGAPGYVAALLLIAAGADFIVVGLSAYSPSSDDDFASIFVLAVWFGAEAVVLGLCLAGATVAVTLERPAPLLLVLMAGLSLAVAAWAAWMLATGADAPVYAPLLAVLVYLAVVAFARLLMRRHGGHA